MIWNLKICNYYDGYNLNIWMPVIWEEISTFATEKVSLISKSLPIRPTFNHRALHFKYFARNHIFLRTLCIDS